MRTTVNIALAVGLVSVMFSVSPTAADEGDESASSQPVMEGLMGGELPWEQAFDEAMLEGRQAYNAERREKARDAFVRAIQILPEQPTPYRNLARNYNLMGDYSRAVRYYDLYLELAPGAEDAETIDAERRGAVSRGGDEATTTPADQRLARRAVDRELDEGPAITDGQGGAWEMYRTLLETGYAAPDLQRFRARLEQKLVDELQRSLETDDSLVPVNSPAQWELHARRIEALEQLHRTEEQLAVTEKRRKLVDAMLILFDGDSERAHDALQRAEKANSDLGWIRWVRIGAYDRAQRPEEALGLVDEWLERGELETADRRRAQAVRARLLQQLGRSDEAADVYSDLLGR